MFLTEKNLNHWKKNNGKYEFEVDSDMINNFREKLFDNSHDDIDEEEEKQNLILQI
jgi:hypothetical protein